MRLFYWGQPDISPLAVNAPLLFVVEITDGGNPYPMPIYDAKDIALVGLLSEGAQEISWMTAAALGWPT